MLDELTRIVVAGAGLAAVRAAGQLRRRGYAGSLVVLGAEARAPYDRPPLSKAVLAGRRDDTALRFDPRALDVDLHLGEQVTGLDLGRRVVRTLRGEIGFDGLLVATGAAPVRLPGDGEQLTLRTADDALALRDRLRPGARVLVVGASWIGAEVATAALARGCAVTCLEAGPAPLAGALGADVGASFLPWWSGVDLRLGVSVAAVQDGGVLLTDGSAVAADVVVTATGVRPDTGWMTGSGLDLDRGVAVDEHLRASSGGVVVPGVVAAGDVAARWSPRARARVRVEHWEDAGSAGTTAAGTLLGAPGDPLPVHDPVPYFWSDQFGAKLQYVGAHGAADRPVEAPEDGRPGRTVTWLDPAGAVTAVLTVDRPRDAAAARSVVAERRELATQPT
ncbi:NAD(P)/FAD-dependent oxidoreductase [Geodermatophilus sp. CPCC 205761]|uniref:NAD(P)/FAD-dependent oxidoreductase n=1 Tax=Geodermatophilus sp. CPCC 205761 TaxID=2936597 RepID=UPI003EEF3F2C